MEKRKIIEEFDLTNNVTVLKFNDGNTGLCYVPTPKEMMVEPTPIVSTQWNKLKDWINERIENANKHLNDPNENWDEDTNGYVLARKFMLQETLTEMNKLEGEWQR